MSAAGPIDPHAFSIVTPWPDPVLTPNQRLRLDRHAGMEASREWRDLGYGFAYNFRALFSDLVRGIPMRLLRIPLGIDFHPPDRRKRDLDGMLGACKPILDGMAQAFGIDDQAFNPITIRRLEMVRGGQVVFRFLGSTAGTPGAGSGGTPCPSV